MGIINKVKKYIKTYTFSLHNFYKSKSNTIFPIVFLAAIGVLLFPDLVYAGPIQDLIDGTLQTIIKIIFWLTSFLQSLTIWFLELFIQVAGYNDFVNENVVQLGWTMVRDIANMFFIVALLVIAFANILGMENYEMKTTLPKLFLMAILVNFSKLIAGIVIDAAHVFTMTFLNAISASAGGNLVGAFGMDEIWGLSDKQFNDIKMQAFLTGVYSLIITLAVAITMFSYFAIMLVRMVALWVLIILSPLAFIAAVLPKTDSITEKWRKKFTNQVMVAPVMVFFLWLAFATMGTGDIGGEIIQNSTAGRGEEVAKLENVSNKMASWDKFLSFVVAVTFLWVGLNVVQSEMDLEGLQKKAAKKGQSAIRSIPSYAKKAGGYAKSGAKKGAEIAGESQIGRRVKAKTKGKLQDLQKGRAEFAQGLKEGDGKASTVLGHAFQTGKQKEAELKKYEREKAERPEELHEAYAKGGAEAGLGGAEAKEREQIRRHQRERAGELGEESQDIIDNAEAKLETGNPQDIADAVVAGFQQDSDVGRAILDEAADKAGSDKAGENPADPEKQVQKFLEAKLGRKRDVDNGESLSNMRDELKEDMGEQEFQATLENLEGNLKAASKEGDINLAGLIQSGELKTDEENDIESIKDERLKRARKINPKEITSLEDIAGDADDDGEIDEQGMKQLKEFLASTGKDTSFDGNFRNELKESDIIDIGELRSSLEGEVSDAVMDNLDDELFGGQADAGESTSEDADEEAGEGGSEASTPGGGGDTSGGGGSEQLDRIERLARLGPEVVNEVEDLESEKNNLREQLGNTRDNEERQEIRSEIESIQESIDNLESGDIDVSTSGEVSESQLDSLRETMESGVDVLHNRIDNVENKIQEGFSRMDLTENQENTLDRLQNEKEDIEVRIEELEGPTGRRNQEELNNLEEQLNRIEEEINQTLNEE